MKKAIVKTIPQGGTTQRGEAPTAASAAVCPSYPGGGTYRLEDRAQSPKKNSARKNNNTSDDFDEELTSGNESSRMASPYETPVNSESGAVASRKRHIEVYPLTSEEEDNDDVAVVAPKIPTARRGRARATGQYTGLSQAKKQLAYMQSHEYENESEEYRKTFPPLGRKERLSPEVEIVTAETLRTRALNSIDDIFSATTRSRNLKGELKKTLIEAANSLSKVVEGYASLSTSDETRRLQADNKRLSHEIDLMKKELTALRQSISERPAEARHASPRIILPNAQTEATPAMGDMFEELKRSILTSVGNMVNARIEDIQDRLLPVKRLRPPLASDGKKASSSSSAGKHHQTQDPIPSTGHPVPPAQAALHAQGGAGEEGWTKVVSRSKKKKKVTPETANPVPADSLATGATKRKGPKTSTVLRKKKLSAPKSSAVVLVISEKAAEEGITYAQAITKAKQEVSLHELGIEGIKIRQTATGGRVLEIPGSTSGEKADLLATKLKSVLNGMVNISRPIKCVDLRIGDLDDSVDETELRDAIAVKGGCLTEQVKVGPIRTGPGGQGVALVKCPVLAAKVIVESGKLLVGWSSARVRALEPLPMRCFKCMAIGHTRKTCPSETDRSLLCFGCAAPGHKVRECTDAPKCAICAELKLPSDHIMGSRTCAPPPVKAKSPPKIWDTTRPASNPVPEEVEMI